MKRAIFSLFLLTLIYALVLASFAPWDLALGVVLSGVLLYAFRGYVFDGSPDPLQGLLRRVLAFGPFFVAAVREIAIGTWQVALVTLRLRPLERPGIVKVPIGERTPVGVVVSALVDTISPGSFLVDIDWEEGCMLIHTIDARDPDAFRRSWEEFYDRYQRKVFP